MNSWRFKCSCGRYVQRRAVEGVLLGGDVSGIETVIVSFHCACQQPEFEVKVVRFPANPSALDYVTHGQGAPYRNREMVRPVTLNHPDLVEWRRVLACYADDADAFVERLTSP